MDRGSGASDGGSHSIASRPAQARAPLVRARRVRALPSMLLLRVSDRIKNFFVLLYYYYVLCASPHAFTRARHPAPVRTTLGLRMHRGVEQSCYIDVIDHSSPRKVKIERHQFGFDTLALPGIDHHE